MNLWHDINPDRIRVEDFVAVIEIGKGTKNKYELDKETGCLILDRVLHTATHYPANYGFIPRTYAEDNDPLDVLVLCSEVIQPLSLVRCYPIGAIRMRDGNENDDKLIAIPFSDPNYNHIHSMEALSPHLVEEFIHFFQVYKELEHKQTAALSVLPLDKARGVFTEAQNRYNARYTGDRWMQENLHERRTRNI